jgi:hypothetical protein
VWREQPEVTKWATDGGLHCRAFASEELWRAECALGEPDERFRTIFARLRALLRAVQGDAGRRKICAAVLHGCDCVEAGPNFVREMVEARQFLAQVDAGVRGVSRNGRLVAFDVPRGQSNAMLVGVLALAPTGNSAKGTAWLWLTSHDRADGSLSQMSEGCLSSQMALAGLGG